MESGELDRLLAGALALGQPLPEGDSAAASVEGSARFHGVECLLHEAGVQAHPGSMARWKHRAAHQAFWEAQHRRIICDALEALAREGIETLILKGTALAYGLYPKPHLRSRSDTDLMVPPEQRAAAGRVLQEAGFTAVPGVSGEFASYQASYTREARPATTHAIDLHWRINNSQVLAGMLCFDELHAHRRALPALSPAAWGPQPVHALLIACMHLASHRSQPYRVDGVYRGTGTRLVWLYDVHLLAGSLSDEEWRDFEGLAGNRGLAGICAGILEKTGAIFGTKLPEAFLARLGDAPAGTRSEYLGMPRMRQAFADFMALPGARPRMRFLQEILLPGREYMRSKYPRSHVPLPLLQAHRVASGCTRWLLQTIRP